MSCAPRQNNDDPYASPRERMIQHDLIGRGIQSASVLAAMAQTPRELFVSVTDRDLAYADRALPISCEQTISQPYMVALMTQLLDLSGTENVLEIGTGSGYQTAILAQLARDIVTIERHAALSRAAEQRLDKIGLHNVEFKIADGSRNVTRDTQFDRILVTAASPRLPPHLVDDLRDSGILVAPIGKSHNQVLVRGVKHGDQFTTDEIVSCRFVPLVTDTPQNADREPPTT